MSEQGKALALPSSGALNLSAGETFRGAFKAARRSDVALALGVIAILAVFILPMPAWLLDICFSLSITIAVVVLMTALFIQRPLDFSSFPQVLLITTLLRLALNLASTKLILSHGHEGYDAAGAVIQAFGELIMGGNFVIGVIVFAILVLVNFIVITKGSSRIAEVAARFSLDAMPGKQMAIDADLSSGILSEDEAKKKRRELEEESSFYGAMDGASKFVRGDAIAGLIIVFVNIIGGIIVGVLQMNMTLGEAARSYTLLTVGDGLVTQIPALVISVAAGLLVSKGGVSGSADKALFGQLSARPSGLGVAALLLALLAIIPGMPKLPFLLCAIGVGALAYYIDRETRRAKAREAMQAAVAPPPPAEEPIGSSLAIDTIRVELGYGLLPLVAGQQPAAVPGSGNAPRLPDQVKALRKQLAAELGFVLPAVRLQDNLQLSPNAYIIKIKELEAARGELRPNMLLAMDPRGAPIPLPGEATTEPAFGLPAMWIPLTYRDEAHFKGLTVVDPSTVITTHLTEVVKDHLPDLLSYAETQKLLDELPREHQKLVADVVPGQISLSGLQRLLQSLLAERVSIRDLPTILEGVAEIAPQTRSLVQITEHVRARLSRQLCEGNMNAQGVVPLLPLGPEWEQAFAESLTGQGDERTLAMPPSRLQQFVQTVRQAYERFAQQGETPVLLTSPAIRPYVRSIIERFRPQTVVMSQAEVHPRARIRTVGQV